MHILQQMQFIFYGLSVLAVGGGVVYKLHCIMKAVVLNQDYILRLKTNHIPHLYAETREIKEIVLLMAGHLGLDVRKK